ncbi:MAG: hypothetical protein KKG75_03545 [Nanoarchaeota archaeon]|nr:hypothetical protein [Nanoarchaeota archaeon]
MAEQQMQPRQVAYKIRIGDLLKGEYVEQEGWQPNFIKVGDKQVSRANIIASVIDKQIGETLSSITLDDGSGDIQVRAFNEESIKLNDIEIGDIVIAIGRPRKYGNRFFISYEIVKKLDSLWAKVRQNELGKTNFQMPSPEIIEVVGVKEEKVREGKEEFYKNKKIILDLIRNIDDGNGANIDDIITNSKIDQKKAEEMIQELIKAGEVYENIAGRVKLL